MYSPFFENYNPNPGQTSSSGNDQSGIEYWDEKVKKGIFDEEFLYPNPLNNQPWGSNYKLYKEAHKNRIRTLASYTDAKNIFDVIRNHQVILITMGTGAGKTVMMPKLMLHYFAYQKKIAINIPRKAITETEGVIKKKVKANFKVLGAKLGANMKEAASAISVLNQTQIAELEQVGSIVLPLQNIQFTLEIADVEVSAEDIPGWSVASKGVLTVALDITITPELQSEGSARELINRIQNIRKDSGLEVTDKIKVQIQQQDELEQAIKNNEAYIMSETLTKELQFVASVSEGIEIEFDDIKTKILISK